MSASIQHVYCSLQAAHNRDDLATTWKVFKKVAEKFEGVDWGTVEEAFKMRAEELGLEWKR
jgi:hypothetical protein